MTISFSKLKLPALVLYVAALSLATMYTINFKHYVMCTVIMTAVALVALFSLNACKRKIAMRVMGVMAIAVIGGVLLVFRFMGDENIELLDYIFAGSSRGFDWTMALVTASVFGLVIGFLCYYFVVFNSGAMSAILVAMIVGILVGRTAGVLPVWMIIVIAFTYLFLIACSANTLSEYTVTISAAKARLICAGILAVVAVVIASLIPRSAAMGGKELINQLVFGDGGYGNTGIGDLHSSSSVNRGNNEWTGSELMRIRADDEKNLIHSAFDQYNGEDGWVPLEYYNKASFDWGYSDADMGNMINLMRMAAADGKLKSYADILSQIPPSMENKTKMSIEYIDSGNSHVVVHPVGTYHIKLNHDVKPDLPIRVYSTDRNEMFVHNYYTGPDLVYDALYCDSDINAEFVRSFTPDQIKGLLIAASNEGVISQNAMLMVVNQMNFARYYNEVTKDEGGSEAITALAKEITAGADNDYDKLVSIIRWFEQEDFVYDLDFVPKESTADYFLFESKRGICSDFATAATLLCRAAGMAAIYTEGFAMNRENLVDGEYIITDAEAHAFAQVYINGHGWVCLDTTGYAEKAEQFEIPQELIVLLIAVVILMLLSSVLVYILRQQLADFWFAVTYRIISPQKAIRGILIRIRREAARLEKRTHDTMSAADTAQVLVKIGMPQSAQRYSDVCNRVTYGGSSAQKDEIAQMYKDYKAIKSVRRYK